MTSLSILPLVIIGLAVIAWSAIEYRSQRHNGAAPIRGRSIVVVTVTYEGMTLNGIRGHLFRVLHWADSSELGTGWVPGPLALAQHEATTMCADHAWSHVSGFVATPASYRRRAELPS